MSIPLIRGSAKPVYLVDPETGKILEGSAVPSYLVDANGNMISWENLNIGDVPAGNYVNISEDGIYLYGEATMWDDLRVSVNAIRVTGANQPGWAVVPGTTNLYTWFFGNSGIDEAWFTVQLPHAWKSGSDIEAHVHWTPSVNGSLGLTTVEWSLDYSWANIGSIYPAEATLTGHEQIPAESFVLAGKHYLTELGTISGTGKTISSMLICRIYRNGGAGNDNFGGNAGLLEIDFHYQIDALGSKEEYVE